MTEHDKIEKAVIAMREALKERWPGSYYIMSDATLRALAKAALNG